MEEEGNQKRMRVGHRQLGFAGRYSGTRQAPATPSSWELLTSGPQTRGDRTRERRHVLLAQSEDQHEQPVMAAPETDESWWDQGEDGIRWGCDANKEGAGRKADTRENR